MKKSKASDTSISQYRPAPGAIRTREFHYAWCGKTEVDVICMKCLSIVVGDACTHCGKLAKRKADSLKQFLASRQEGLDGDNAGTRGGL